MKCPAEAGSPPTSSRPATPPTDPRRGVLSTALIAGACRGVTVDMQRGHNGASGLRKRPLGRPSTDSRGAWCPSCRPKLMAALVADL